jgi:hypothetical protein
LLRILGIEFRQQIEGRPATNIGLRIIQERDELGARIFSTLLQLQCGSLADAPASERISFDQSSGQGAQVIR